MASKLGIAVAFSNTPQAKDDVFTFGETVGGAVTFLNVMANDSGGNAKSLYSVDDGVNSGGPTGDLLVKDQVGVIGASALGARIWITADGRIAYDASTLDLNSLAQGQVLTDTVTYAIQLGKGALSWATVTVTISGSNDTPIIQLADATGVVIEDGSTPTLSTTGAIGFDDADLTDTHSVTVVAAVANGLGGVLTASITDVATGSGAGSVTWSYSVANSATQYLAAGEIVTETYTVTVSDGQGGSFNQMVTITITGTNDAPVVTGAVTGVATEDGAGVTLDALANASDVDAGAILSVVDVPGALPAGVTYNPATGSFTLDPANAAYQSLAAGATTSVSVSYGVSDGTVTTPASVSWTVTGTNDAPVAVGDMVSTDEDTSVTITVLGNDTDIDGDTLTITQIDGQAASVGVAVNLSSGGTATLNADKTITYTPAADANGQKTFTYTASDGNGGANTATVTVDVAPIAAPASIRFGGTAPLTPLDAGDVLVSSAVAQRETLSTVQALADGGYVIAWSGFGVGAGFGDTFLQRYSAAGERVGPEVKVNATNSLYEWIPTIAALGDGGYVVAWMTESGDGSGRGITAQRFGADGSRVGAEFRVNTTTAGAQQYPVVTELPDGGFLAIWSSDGQDGSGDGIYSQRFALDGGRVGSEVRINTTTVGGQFTPAVATLPDGGFVVSWVSDGQDGSGFGIFGQRFAANGVATGPEFAVNSSVTGDQQYPDVAALSDGGYVITWSSLGGQDGSSWGVFGQRYSASGSAVGSEFLVNTYTASEQRLQSVIGLPDGGFLITWASRGQDGSGFGMFGQRYDSSGVRVGSELQLNANSAGNQFNDQSGGTYAVALTTDGTLVQLFTNDQSVFMRRFDTQLQQNGIEDQAFGLTVQVSPSEPGETVTQVVLSGFPAGSVLSAGVSSNNGQTWTFTGSPPANLTLTPPANYNGTFTLTVTATTQDGTDTETATASRAVTVTSVNDAPVVTGAVTGVATEDGAGVTLDALANASDVDAGAILSVVDVPGALPAGVTYNPATGSFTLDPANAAYQSLAAGATTSVSVSYGVSDGTVTTPASVSWTVTGTNDAPAIGGVSTGSVTEDTATSASGAVTISDADTGQSSFQPQSGLAGNYGSLNINTAGNWTYFLNNSLPAVQSLSAGQTLSDTVTVRAADGTNHVLNFTISGTNEPGVATTLFTSGADVGVTFYSNSNSSSIGNEPYTIGQGAVSFGYDVSYSNTTNNTAMAGFLADKEVLIFPELEGGSGTTIGAQVGAAVAAFVNGGGTLVVNSASGQQFLNAAFGFGLSGGSGGTSVLSSGAAGTLFANNASNLSDNSAVYGGSLISSLPAGARVIYADNAGTNANVFVLQQGQGQITFLAWDWFNASPVGTANGGWIEVLRDALSYGGNRSSTLNDPIAIDLDGDGVHFGGAVDFDLSADGIAETLVWTSPRDGLLVMDLDGSGAIENGREVLSEVFDGFGYGSSMEALRSLDTNIDGKVDAADERFAALRVWRDANSDGVSQAEELLSFDELGIESISVVETVQNSIVDGQQAYAAGTFTYLNGESGDYSAVYLSAPATEGMTADGTNASPMLISDDDIVPTYSAPLGYESALATEQEPGVVYEAELAFMMLGLDTTSPTDSTGFAPEETALADPLGLGQPPVYTPADDGAIL